MRFDKVIQLKSYAYTKNRQGDTIKKPEDRQVLAKKKSIRQSEFYQAQAVGLRPEITFIMWEHEYDSEDALEYNERTYNILRTYKTDEKKIELVCQAEINSDEVTR